MQIDMHFYGVYALARAAGVNQNTARIIAYASQFVDDAIDDEAIVLEDRNAVLPIMTAHKAIDYQNTIPSDQWNVWVPFHFLPGNAGKYDTFLEKMVCQKNSALADEILKHALEHKKEPMGPYLAGVTAHVYADTFAHYGFIGLSRDYNRVRNGSIKVEVRSGSIFDYVESKFETFTSRIAGTFAEAVPVGHGAVATYPDRPYLKWRYFYESGGVVERDNVIDYMEACEKLHEFFIQFASDNNKHGRMTRPRAWNNLKDEVEKILKKEEPKEKRIDLWKKAIKKDKLFTATNKDKGIQYLEKDWNSGVIEYYFEDNNNLDGCDPYLFIQAARKHRSFVLDKLLPDFQLIIL
jgi:Family of unknown function (DUF6765)